MIFLQVWSQCASRTGTGQYLRLGVRSGPSECGGARSDRWTRGMRVVAVRGDENAVRCKHLSEKLRGGPTPACNTSQSLAGSERDKVQFSSNIIMRQSSSPLARTTCSGAPLHDNKTALEQGRQEARCKIFGRPHGCEKELLHLQGRRARRRLNVCLRRVVGAPPGH